MRQRPLVHLSLCLVRLMCAHHGQRGRYDPAMRRIWPWPAVLLEAVVGCINDLPGDLWLDAACGGGQLGRLLGRQKRLLGLDLDRERLREAHVHPYQALIQGSIDCLPLASGSLDGIVSVETLEHVVGMDLALREFARCLRNNGDRKSTRLNSSHSQISYAVFCLKKKTQQSRRLRFHRCSPLPQ